MPLSKAKNRERMARIRLHRRLNALIVQPKPIKEGLSPSYKPEIDADGNVIPELS